MKNYLFAASRLIFEVGGLGGSKESADSKKIEFSSGNEIAPHRPSKKEQIKGIGLCICRVEKGEIFKRLCEEI
jgi:hypothetical protein